MNRFLTAPCQILTRMQFQKKNLQMIGLMAFSWALLQIPSASLAAQTCEEIYQSIDGTQAKLDPLQDEQLFRRQLRESPHDIVFLRDRFQQVLQTYSQINDWESFRDLLQKVLEFEKERNVSLFSPLAMQTLLTGLKDFSNSKGREYSSEGKYIVKVLDGQLGGKPLNVPPNYLTQLLAILKKPIGVSQDPSIARWVIDQIKQLPENPEVLIKIRKWTETERLDPYVLHRLQLAGLVPGQIYSNPPKIPARMYQNKYFGAHEEDINLLKYSPQHIAESELIELSHPHSRFPLTDKENKNLRETIEYAWLETYSRSYEEYMNALRASGFDPAAYKGKVVMDLGSGLSEFVDYLAGLYGIDAYGVDLVFLPQYGALTRGDKPTYPHIMEAMHRYGLDPKRRIGASVTNIPLEDSSVDAIVEYTTLKYLQGNMLPAALEEALRLLKPGGKAYFNASKEIIRYLNDWGILYEINGRGVDRYLTITKPHS